MSATSPSTFSHAGILVAALLGAGLPWTPGPATAQVQSAQLSDAPTVPSRNSDSPATRRDDRGHGGVRFDFPLDRVIDALHGAEEPASPPAGGVVPAAVPTTPGDPGSTPVTQGGAATGALAVSPPPVATRRAGSGVPPANERRLVPGEVVIELANGVSTQEIDALDQRQRLTTVDGQSSLLSGTTLLRSRIRDRRSVSAVVRALEADPLVLSAQPNYRFALQEQDVAPATRGDEPLQYAPAKLRLPEAHALATGGNVLVAVIDSGVDASHPELQGAIAGTFDMLQAPGKPHSHGTAIAGLIAAHAKLIGSAPAAGILAACAFDPAGPDAEGSTFNILKGLDWEAMRGAHIINMSFAGPADPALHRSLEAAHARGIVLIAAAGNAGAKSPPLYPGADPNVVAVTATDAEDKLFAAANRGPHVAVAAPGVDILVAVPDGAYRISSGTSLAAAEVSGVAALVIQRRPDLGPDAVRAILLATARSLGRDRRDERFGAGLVDAYQAVSVDAPPPMAPAEASERQRVLTGTR
jgi:subtilisin family serine protease